ncbi:MAG: ATP synthase F1 subunit epsilon [Candidatus Pacebacteria bacterium]|nr:ATP synthase F1 subunit epsilon [Candidatus Paceibacterota bacterium]
MSTKKIKLTIATPLREVYQNEIDQLTVTTLNGELTILPDHVPLVVPLQLGQVMVKNEGNEVYHAIDGGLLEVRHDNEVIILSNRAENASDIDIKRSEDAIERAKEVMAQGTLNEDEYVEIERNIQRGLNRVKLAQKGQRK